MKKTTNNLSNGVLFIVAILCTLLSTNSAFAQLKATASIGLPIIEIKDAKTQKLVKAIKIEEPVTIIHISEDQNFVFAHSPNYVYRVNISSLKIDKINLEILYSPMSEEQSTTSGIEGVLGNNSEPKESKNQKRKTNKRFYHSNPLNVNKTGFLSTLNYLSGINFSSEDIFFNVKQSWMDQDTYEHIYKDIVPIYSLNFETRKIEEVINLKYMGNAPFLLCRDETLSHNLYFINNKGVVNSMNLKLKQIKSLFTIDKPIEFKDEMGFLYLKDNQFGVIFLDMVRRIKITQSYDKTSFKKTKEITLEGDGINAIPIKFNNRILWYYVKAISIPAPIFIEAPEYPIYKRGKKYNLEVENWNKINDSISILNKAKMLKWSEKPTTYIKSIVFSDEELLNKKFEFSNVSLIELVAEDILSVTYDNQVVEQYNITTKELIKTTRKKATNIDDF